MHRIPLFSCYRQKIFIFQSISVHGEYLPHQYYQGGACGCENHTLALGNQHILVFNVWLLFFSGLLHTRNRTQLFNVSTISRSCLIQGFCHDVKGIYQKQPVSFLSFVLPSNPHAECLHLLLQNIIIFRHLYHC